MKKIILFSLVFSLATISSYAQCAMCRATLENNFSNGNVGIAAGINFGIMYLFFSPYILAAVIIYFWYKTSRKNANKSVESNWAG